jgi:hypothetical protein
MKQVVARLRLGVMVAASVMTLTARGALAADLPATNPSVIDVASAGPDSSGAQSAAASTVGGGSVADWFAHWEDRVHQAQASQPHWITPLVTVTPRLEQEIRYDQLGESMGNGALTNVFDGGKGLELIPTTTNEVIFNAPPYLERFNKKPASGLNDWPFLLIKQRFLSANEENGNYIVTGFFSVQAPAGVAAFSNNAWVITPTLAAGKGWGRFDIQGTLGAPIPLENESKIGIQVATNIALQYHLGELFWPELEFNSTYWVDGPRGGKTQLFITPGLIVGRIKMGSGYKLILGGGYQIAVAPKLNLTPVLTPLYNTAYVLTARVTF